MTVLLGLLEAPTHWRDPTTAHHECFWLLGFPPDSIRSSLVNLVTEDSSSLTILMIGLVRTPVQHRQQSSRNPKLKTSTTTSFPGAGLQKYATLPAEKSPILNVFIIYYESNFANLRPLNIFQRTLSTQVKFKDI